MKLRSLAALAGFFIPALCWAEITVSNAWVRGTVPGQSATGAYMEIRSSERASLVSVASPGAKVAEIHEMAMDGNVMRMRGVPRLDLPAGRAVELKPGGYHVMLMGLARSLKKGEVVPITLTFEGAAKQRQEVEIKAEVRDLAAAAAKHHSGH